MKTMLIWIGVFFIGVIVIAVAWYVFFAPKPEPQTPGQSGTLPQSGSITIGSTTPVSSSTSTPAVSTISLTLADGSVVVVNDFMNDGITLPDKANPGRYLLAGNLGYCLTDPQECQAGPSVDYDIYYDSTNQTFTIDLVAEPIGAARADAENFLLGTLGLTERELCGLNYYLGTTIYVNAQFAGKNLGFSFCPGATALPK